MNPSVSLVIPTYNRHQVLKDLLEHINSIQFQAVNKYDFSIWILDQSTKSFTYDYANHKYSLNYRKLNTPGLPNARNWALNNIQSDILIFIDDDVELGKEFIKGHVEAHQSDKRIGAVAGKIVERDNLKPGIKYSSTSSSKMYGISLLGIFYQNRGGDKETFCLGFPGGNFSLRREAVNQVGYFDLKYGGNAQLEETDYAYRLRDKGYKILFDPGASLVHYAISSGGCRVGDEVQKKYWRMHNTTYFTLRNRSPIIFPIYFMFSVLVSLILAFQISGFSKIGLKIPFGIFKGAKSYLEIDEESHEYRNNNAVNYR